MSPDGQGAEDRAEGRAVRAEGRAEHRAADAEDRAEVRAEQAETRAEDRAVTRDESRVKMTDRRLLILYLINIAVVLAVSSFLYRSDVRQNADRTEFNRQVVANCLDNQKNSRNFNDFIDTLNQTTNRSRLLTDKEKRERQAFFESAKGIVPKCPPG